MNTTCTEHLWTNGTLVEVRKGMNGTSETDRRTILTATLSVGAIKISSVIDDTELAPDILLASREEVEKRMAV